MKAFVTGGSGFIGQRIIRKLLARKYAVYALVRSPESADIVSGLGATAVPGDITDVNSMRESMTGSDVVFHVAAWYKIGSPDSAKADAINVGGTRNVLKLAHELGVPKIIYTSTVGVFGDTKGEAADENYFQGAPFLTEYERTKWLAHYKVAVPLIEKGAPIVIVMPGGVYGPGDGSAIADLMRQFYRGMPIMLASDMTMTYAHVDDVAEGHLLAMEKGKIGESYILTGPAVPLGEMVDFWAHLLGKHKPILRVPSQFIRPFAPLVGAVESTVPLPPTFSREATLISGATYIARSDKARRELGWRTRPLQAGMLETFQWLDSVQRQRPAPVNLQEKKIAAFTLSAAVILFMAWLMNGRRST